MDDDIAALAIELASLVEEAGDRGVVAIFHSAGGFLGSAAMKGLSVEARKLSGKAGGVRAIVFLAAGVLLEGAEQESWPFMEVNFAAMDDVGVTKLTCQVSNGTQTCRNPMDLLFHDFPSMETHKWLELIQHQPVNWGTTLNYCGWREVPSTYIICEADRLLPMELQEQMASLASSRKVRLPNAGHMAQLSHVHEVAVAVREACQ
ncbi:hypothetical protein N7470_007260 [Penicillium chermesinum]|nr:hypothetical protein N7470_007260 [Penicillium chermesinum]